MHASELSALALAAPWVSSPGPDNDVVIASRVRLSRNLAEYPFPGSQTEGPGDSAGIPAGSPAANAAGRPAASQAAERVVAAVREELTPEPFGVDTLDINPGSLSAEARGLLAERSALEEPLPARLYLTADESMSISVCSVDHLRAAAILPGMDIRAALSRVREVDLSLERSLNYAVSLDWGYLSTEILNLGTAMRASVLVHLPALVALQRLAEISASLKGTGFELIDYPKAHKAPAGVGLALLRNRRTLGSDEDAICAKLEEYTTTLVHYERVAREELCAAHGSKIADTAHRALGLLRFARSLSDTEAYTLVSELRLGVVAGVVDEVSIEGVTALFPIIQENHVHAGRGEGGESSVGDGTDVARAALVRRALGES